MAAIAFILFAVTANAAPDLTALAAFPSEEACNAALATINEALEVGEDKKQLVCLSTDALQKLAESGQH